MAGQQNFAECVAHHLPYLTRIVYGLTRGDEMTEDIVQQTVLKALIHADQFRFESALKTWLGSIAINEVHQLYRSKSRARVVPLLTEEVEVYRNHPVELPTDSYEAKERDSLVRHAVSCLPTSYRSVVELCDLQRLPLAEAARKLGLTVHAVKSRRHRAREKLRPFVAKLKLRSENDLPSRVASRKSA